MHGDTRWARKPNAFARVNRVPLTIRSCQPPTVAGGLCSGQFVDGCEQRPLHTSLTVQLQTPLSTGFVVSQHSCGSPADFPSDPSGRHTACHRCCVAPPQLYHRFSHHYLKLGPLSLSLGFSYCAIQYISPFNFPLRTLAKATGESEQTPSGASPGAGCLSTATDVDESIRSSRARGCHGRAGHAVASVPSPDQRRG